MKKIFLLLVLSCVTTSLAQTRPAGRGPQAPLPPGAKAMRDIEYVKDGGNAQSLDLYLPEKSDKPLPLIIWIHGGGWMSGDKTMNPAMVLLRFGYAVASVNYRLTDVAKFPAQINDCKAAVRWLRAHAKDNNIDPDRIGAWGASAGGHLVALLGTAGDAKDLEGNGGNPDVSSNVQAVCDFFGPSDITKSPGEKADSIIAQFLGGPLAEKMDLAKQASPITYVTKDDPPFLIMQGQDDPLVNPNQSQMLNDALKKVGVEVTLELIPGAGHGGQQFATPERRKMILDFFDRHLKK